MSEGGNPGSGVRSKILGIVRAVVSVSIVAVLVARSNPADLSLRPDSRLFAGMAAAVLLIGLALFFSAVRWRLVLGRGSPPAVSLFRLYLMGWFFSLFLPTSIGGDAVRTVALVRSRVSAGAALSSIVLERLLGMCALFALLVIGVIVAPSTPAGFFESIEWSLTGGRLAIAVGVAVAGLVAVTLVAFRSARVRGLVRDAFSLVREFRDRPGSLLAAIAASVAVQSLYIITWIVLAWCVRLDVPPAPFLVYVPFISIAAMLPVTLSGLGLREGAWVLLLAPLGIATASAVTFSLLYYVAGLCVGIVGAILFLTSGLRTELGADSADDVDNVRATAAAQPV